MTDSVIRLGYRLEAGLRLRICEVACLCGEIDNVTHPPGDLRGVAP